MARSVSIRTMVAQVGVAVIVVFCATAGTHSEPAIAAGPPNGACWRAPVDAPVVDPFRAPACPWCPGNRGIEYATRVGTVVRAVAAGVVTFSGPVAGTTYVVVRHADGRRATYGGLGSVRPAEGDRVVAGGRVGTTVVNFHFGLRDGDQYLDPTPHLGRPEYRARLVPSDGWRPRPAPPPVLRCANAPARVRGPPRPTDVGIRYTRRPVPSFRTEPTSDPSRNHPPLPRSPSGRLGTDATTALRRNHHGRHHHAPDARSRRPLRTPDASLEPEDEEIHLR